MLSLTVKLFRPNFRKKLASTILANYPCISQRIKKDAAGSPLAPSVTRRVKNQHPSPEVLTLNNYSSHSRSQTDRR